MTTEVSTDTLPDTEGEIVSRLKIKPERIKVTMTSDKDSDHVRHWTELTYDFKGKIGGFGRFLSSIVQDIFQAGGAVTNIDLGTGLKVTDPTETYTPDGQWRAMHVHVSIKPAKQLHEENAAWLAAAREIMKGGFRR